MSGRCRHPNFGDSRLPDRFWERCIPEPNGGCWLWIGCLSKREYGKTFGNGRHQKAHRFAYDRLIGPIPDGLTIDHLCRVTCCVNPAHLEPVTMRTNVMRGTSFAVKNSLVTHCPYGHEYTPDNITWNHGNKRTCKACGRRRRAERRLKNRDRENEKKRADRRAARLARVIATHKETP